MTPHPFDWTHCYPSVRWPTFGHNIVATSHPLAAQAGLRMLLAGGNAVDAAIAAAAVMTIVEPCSNGLGSDAFAIVWDGTSLHGLNAAGPAPAAWTRERFASKYGADAKAPPRRGPDSVTVPGAIAGWAALSGRFGKLPFADLLQPAIQVAERGYAVPVIVAQKWAAAAALPELAGQPGFAEAFLPRGRAPGVGERFVFGAAARTLQLVADTKGRAFYDGEVADATVRHLRAHGGATCRDDLACYRPEWVVPIAKTYRGYTLHEMPPSGQGIAAQIALGILEHFDLAALPLDGVALQHLQIEAMKLAFADVYAHVAEAASMRCTPAQMLDGAYLQSRARLIDPKRAQHFGAGNPARGGTIYLAAADESGTMVSYIQSNYMGFGSGVVVPGYGVSLQNRGHGFSLDAASPNVVAPAKRPFHTIVPGFVTSPDAASSQPLMAFGVMGANMQPQGHVQTLVRMLDHRQHPQAACDAPRWRFNEGLSLNAEASMGNSTVRGLAALGHRIEVLEDSYQDFGAGQFIWRLGHPAEEGYVAASDARRDGAAVAY